jgi:hypothetical protein
MNRCEVCGRDQVEVSQLSGGGWRCLEHAKANLPRLEDGAALRSPTPSAPSSGQCALPWSSSLSLSHQGQEQADDGGATYGDELLADVAAGAIDVVDVELPNVPDDASEIVRRVVQDFTTLAGARLAVGDHRAVPYACRWAASRLGVSYMTVNRVLTSLVAWGALRDEGAMPGRGARGTRLYAPAQADAVVLQFPERRTA